MDKEENIFDDIHMLQNPLLTEEGFVNEACLNELSKALKNMPKTYERLKNDPEWAVKKWTCKSNILGSFAKYAVQASPYFCPEGLEKVLGYLNVCLNKEINWFDTDDILMAELSLCEINKILYDILYEQNIEIFDSWNKPKKNWRKEKLENCPIDPDYDFIDLDALLHNVCLDIRMERREDDRFEKERRKRLNKNGE